MKDIQGILRGKCNECECEEYRTPPSEDESASGRSGRLRCEYCNHTPVEHVRIIVLGACQKCGEDNCDKYESEEKFGYTDCSYCGCPAQHHSGAEKLIKKQPSASVSTTSWPSTTSDFEPRKDSRGAAVQTSQNGVCKRTGCEFPRRMENGKLHDYCSRTCSEKARTAFNPTPPATPVCVSCKNYPAHPGHKWCALCYSLYESQQQASQTKGAKK